MKARILTLAFDPELGCFDDEAVRHFLADKELIELHDHFFTHQGLPYLAVVLTYRRGTSSMQRPASVEKRPPRDSWRELLEPGDMPVRPLVPRLFDGRWRAFVLRSGREGRLRFAPFAPAAPGEGALLSAKGKRVKEQRVSRMSSQAETRRRRSGRRERWCGESARGSSARS